MKVKKWIFSFISDSLFRNSFYLVANSIIGSLAGFVFWFLAARLYTAGDIGLASTIISTTGLIALISNLGFSISLIRFLSDLKEEARNLINSCFTVSASISCIISVIFVLEVEIFSPALSIIRSNIIYAAIFILFSILTIISSLQNSIFVGYRKVNLSFFKIAIENSTKIPILFYFIAYGSYGIIASYAIAYIVSILIALLILIPKVNAKYLPIPIVDLHIMKGIFHYSAGNYIAGILEIMPNFVLPIIITNMLNTEMTAYFYITWMIAGIIFMIPNSIATSLFAEGSSNEAELTQNIRKYLKFTILLVVSVIVVIFFEGEKMLMLYGNEYSVNGEKLLWSLAISVIPMTFNNIYIAMKRVQKNINAVILANLMITGITLLVSLFTIKILGILGVGIGWLVSQVITNIYIYMSHRGFLNSIKLKITSTFFH